MFITKENIHQFNAPARRIVSVVPSQTELLHSLGLDEEVVGITKFCIHPEIWFRSKQRIGGTKNLNLDKIRELKPDLIIANKEENQQEQIETLAQEFPLYMSDIFTLDDSFEAMELMAKLTGKTEEQKQITTAIKSSFSAFKPDTQNRKVLYLIWRDPYMAAGESTFINNMMNCCGWENVLAGQSKIVNHTRYPQLTREEMSTLDPDLILLSSEPYPFKEKHIEELQLMFPKAAVKLVDGEMFSWYGSRLKFSTNHFSAVIESIRYL